MAFSSAAFLFLFFPALLICYFCLPARLLTARNGFLLAASWLFYIFAGLASAPFLLATCVLTWLFAQSLEKRRSRKLLVSALCLFIGTLFLLKYLTFVTSLLSRCLGVFGLAWSPVPPSLPLPAGISFYFFLSMGYLIDVYRGNLTAERSFLKTALFISFFPCVLSGPINRAEALLPQFDQPHPFQYGNFKRGGLRFLWGLFKKLVIADRLAVVVNTVFAAPADFGALQVAVAACGFSIQIYCDFSAYSDMAIGAAQMLGFTLTENFRTPYFSRSIAEFWRRWHISLSTWFRDYLYIPLGGSRHGPARKWRNILIVFTVSGLWHGAALTFLAWGALNGLYQVAGGVSAPARAKLRAALRIKEDGTLLAVWQTLCVFVLSTVAWVFFKSGSVMGAFTVLRHLVKSTLWVSPLSGMGMDWKEFLVAGIGFLLLLAVEATGQKRDMLQSLLDAPRPARWCAVLGLLWIVVVFGNYGTGYDAQSFIYVQF